MKYREVGFIDYLANVFFINGFIGTKYVDGSHWYITYLISFYLIFSLIHLICKKKKNDKALLLSLLLYIITKNILLITINYIPKMTRIYNLIGGNFIDAIIIGILIKMIYKKNSSILLYIILILSFISIIYNQGLIVSISILVFSFFVLKSLKKPILKKNNFMVTIGDNSYITYLIHQNIGYIILLFICKIINNVRFLFIIDIFLIIFFILLSYLINILYCQLKKKGVKNYDKK